MAISTTSPSAFSRCFIEPYAKAIESFKESANPSYSLATRVAKFTLGLLLLLPIINTIIYLVLPYFRTQASPTSTVQQAAFSDPRPASPPPSPCAQSVPLAPINYDQVLANSSLVSAWEGFLGTLTRHEPLAKFPENLIVAKLKSLNPSDPLPDFPLATWLEWMKQSKQVDTFLKKDPRFLQQLQQQTSLDSLLETNSDLAYPLLSSENYLSLSLAIREKVFKEAYLEVESAIVNKTLTTSVFRNYVHHLWENEASFFEAHDHLMTLASKIEENLPIGAEDQWSGMFYELQLLRAREAYIREVASSLVPVECPYEKEAIATIVDSFTIPEDIKKDILRALDEDSLEERANLPFARVYLDWLDACEGNPTSHTAMWREFIRARILDLEQKPDEAFLGYQTTYVHFNKSEEEGMPSYQTHIDKILYPDTSSHLKFAFCALFWTIVHEDKTYLINTALIAQLRAKGIACRPLSPQSLMSIDLSYLDTMVRREIPSSCILAYSSEGLRELNPEEIPTLLPSTLVQSVRRTPSKKPLKSSAEVASAT